MFSDFIARKRYGASVVFGAPLSLWALDRLARAAVRRAAVADSRGPQGASVLPAGVQQRRFLDRCGEAVREVPYYAALKLDPADVANGLVPVTPKAALRSAPDAFVRRSSRPVRRVTTTGTTGDPTQVYFSEREWQAIGALSAIGLIRSRLLRADDIVHIGISPRAVLPHQGVTYPCAVLGAVVSVVGMVPPEVALPLLTRRHDLPDKVARVSVITGNPSYVGHLVEAGLAAGLGPESFGVERLLIGGEFVTEGLRRRAERLFGPVRVFERYALTEMVPFGGALCEHDHLHFDPALGQVEVLDPTTREPAVPGEPGTIVATPFAPFRETTVLVRYDTADVVRRIVGPLECSLAHLPATSHVLGRFGSAVRHPAGWTFGRDIAEALESVDEVPLPARYGFWADGDGVAVEVLVRTGSESTARVRIGDALEARGVPLRTLTTVASAEALRRPVVLRCHFDEGRFLTPVP